jgi:hypothetical protein
MSPRLRAIGRYLIECALALAPWVLAMYIVYWLDANAVWTADTPHRGKLSVLLLATGMLLSFLVQSRFLQRRRR